MAPAWSRRKQEKGHEGIGVVPVFVGDDPKEEDQPALGHGGLVPQAEGQLGEKAGFKGPLQEQIEFAEQTARKVCQPGQELTGQTVRPGAGRGPLPAQGAEKGAFVNLAIAPGPDADRQAMEAAVLIGGQEKQKDVVKTALL